MESRSIAKVGVFLIMGIAVLAGIAHGSDPKLNQVQTLLKELETLNTDMTREEGLKTSLEEEKKRLTQTGDLIKDAEKRLVQEFDEHDRRYKADQEDIAKYKAYGCEGEDLSPEKSQYCNQWRGRENPKTERLKDERKTFVERSKAITERREGLNKAVGEWAGKTKENNAKLNQLYARHKTVVDFVRFLTVNPHYRQLIQKAGASEECAAIEGVENLEKKLNGAAERAHRCLQKIWDGAR
jgi:chromosome segregation ATPase